MKIHHADHGVSEQLIAWALLQVKAPGFFALTFQLGEDMPSVRNALHGPACGDETILEDEVHYAKRSEDRPLSRLCVRPVRLCKQLTVIGIRGETDGIEDEGQDLIFTAYGGPLAAREPGDPSLTPEELEEAHAFWSKHALTDPAPLPLHQLRAVVREIQIGGRWAEKLRAALGKVPQVGQGGSVALGLAGAALLRGDDADLSRQLAEIDRIVAP